MRCIVNDMNELCANVRVWGFKSEDSNVPCMTMSIFPNTRPMGASGMSLEVHGKQGYVVPFHPLLMEAIVKLWNDEQFIEDLKAAYSEGDEW